MRGLSDLTNRVEARTGGPGFHRHDLLSHKLGASRRPLLFPGRWVCQTLLILLSSLLPLAAAELPGVSYSKEIVPIFKRSCTGCHHPGKLKGELDLTTYAALQK